jgi:hypothetical protein
VDGHVIEGFWNSQERIGTLTFGPRGLATHVLARAKDGQVGLRHWLKSLIRRPATLSLARTMRRKLKQVQHNLMLGGASLAPAVELLAPVL